MPEYPESAGMAALSICEALLLALKDLQVMPEHEISGILRDAAAFHENAAGTIAEIERNQKAAALINQINTNGNSTR
ncbi:hypothetical protein DL239_19420 [Sedimentitalea sp. CY04]|uniref:Uncharacterized protein n=1 Tax=Parasedimentitalea denitrificans TaxID=2211118 RepID=A0ABX0WEB4_9RHOB|nr:hypothetical protein [Sedimentitalea sp. CY04]NIZ63139.1 hypothetical protein [Sedimentitalea sp. CY04]